MVSQVINRWFRRLFAWWPWKRSPETSDRRVISTLNKGAAQEPTLRTTVEGSIEFPGISSVAVEHAELEPATDPDRATLYERPESITPSPSGVEESFSANSLLPVQAVEASNLIPDTSASTQQQKLEFLQYLVRRGLVNEGFAAGEEPDQYK